MSKTLGRELACDCYQQIDDGLREHNTKLKRHLLFNILTGGHVGTALAIETEKIDTKKRASKKTIFAAYCPFCGKPAT